MKPMRIFPFHAAAGLIILAVVAWSVMPGFASPILDGGAAATETPTNTPEPTETHTPEPTAEPTQAPTEGGDGSNPDVRPDEQATETPESGGANNTTSVLGFLLCVGIIIVMGLLALNFWPRRTP